MKEPNKENCRHRHLKWIAEGDRRLACVQCKALFVLCDGIPTPIVAENGEHTYERT